MRIVFYGTPEFAVASLEALLDAGHEIAGVVTAPDKLGGRGGKRLIQSAVKGFAERRHLPIAQPTNLKGEAFAKTLRAWAPELQVVVAFRMLPESVWALPPLGTVNVHGSLLPAYRGAAPIHWAVINGERETGVTVFFLRHAIDTGNVLLQARTDIGPSESTGEVYERLMRLGAATLVEAVVLIAAGQVTGRPQDEALASHAPKLTRDNTRIHWDWDGRTVVNFVRGLQPYPAAYTEHEGKEVKLIRATPLALTDIDHAYHLRLPSVVGAFDKLPAGAFAFEPLGGGVVARAGEDFVLLDEVKPAGSRAMSGVDFWNGLRGSTGWVFG